MSGRLVGVLGGTGPAATAYFLQRLVERTEARCDQDHVRTLAFNDTAIPDRTAFLLGRSDRSPLEALIEDGRLLEACGCDLLALPCNTAHGFFDEVKAGRPVDAAALERLAAPFRAVGCDGVVLGCTELSLAFGGVTRAAGLPVVDALDVLADCVIMRAGRPSKTSKNLSLQN